MASAGKAFSITVLFYCPFSFFSGKIVKKSYCVVDQVFHGLMALHFSILESKTEEKVSNLLVLYSLQW